MCRYLVMFEAATAITDEHRLEQRLCEHDSGKAFAGAQIAVAEASQIAFRQQAKKMVLSGPII
jgi:hypothetical protein